MPISRCRRRPRRLPVRSAPGTAGEHAEVGTRTTRVRPPRSPRLARAGLPDRPSFHSSRLSIRARAPVFYDLWVRAVEALNGQAPALVWAGETARRKVMRAIASNDASMRGAPHPLLQGPTDGRWQLYENSAYTITLELRGLGMPVSNRSPSASIAGGWLTSLPEAGEGWHSTPRRTTPRLG
jgi:hypothetical protein